VSQEATRSSFDSERRASFGSILREKAISEESGRDEDASVMISANKKEEVVEVKDKGEEKDILADMEAFEKELEELRAKFKDGS